MFPTLSYREGPTISCTADGCGLALDGGVFPWPDPQGIGYEAIWLIWYPHGGTPVATELTRSHQDDQHESAYPTMEQRGPWVTVAYARTTYASLSCPDRVRGGLLTFGSIAAPGAIQRFGDGLWPSDPSRQWRCAEPVEQPAHAAGATLSQGATRTLLTPPVAPRGLGAHVASTTVPPANCGWSTALVGPWAYTYDSSALGGPWVRYMVDQLGRPISAPWPLVLPADAGTMWMDDVGAYADGSGYASLWTVTGATPWTNTVIREMASQDGITWVWTSRTWAAEAGRTLWGGGYVRRLSDGALWDSAIVAMTGNGGGAANGEGDWQVVVLYQAGSTLPLADLLKPVVVP